MTETTETPKPADAAGRLVMPRWELGYRCHGYWINNIRIGHVSLAPRGYFDGDYVWELDGTQERGHAFFLRTAKRLVAQAYLRHNDQVSRPQKAAQGGKGEQ